MSNVGHELEIDHDQCAWKRCKQNSDLFYIGIPLCDEHWEYICIKNLRTFKQVIINCKKTIRDILKEDNSCL